jgi:hypothetical protein
MQAKYKKLKYRNFMIIILATLMLLSPLAILRIPTASAGNYGTPINTLATVYGDSWGSSSSSNIASNYNFLITNFPDMGANPSLVKTYNPNVLIIGYKDLVFTKTEYRDWSTVNAHEDWFIHDNAGNRIKSTVFTTAYLMDTSSAGWRQYWSTYVNNQLASYPAFNGVMADDTWTQLSYVSNWGELKDASTGATLTSSNIPSNALSNWNINVQGMLQYVKANLPYGKIIIPNTDEASFGSYSYLSVADGAMMEGYMHASFEGVNSHTYVSSGLFANSLAYLQYGASIGKIMLTEAGCTTNDDNTVQFSYAGFLLGSGATAYWGWNTGTAYVSVSYQPLMSTNIGSPASAYYQSQNVYMRDFTNGKVLSNPTPYSYSVYVGNGYTYLNGGSVSTLTLNAYSAAILSTTTYTSPPASTPQPTSAPSSSSSATFGTTTVGGSIATLYTGIPRATQYTPPSSGTLTDVVLYLTGGGSGRHAQVAVYADNGNVPGALLAKSSSDAITSDGWHDFSGFNVAITGGTPVWLACETDSGSLLWYYNAGGANYYQGSGSSGYGTFPSWYTAGSYGAYTTSIYAVYTPSSASSSSSSSSATFGTTTVGGSIATLYTGIPRATQYTPPSSGTLTDVVLYLTGGGSGRHAQVAVYADNGNVPGALLAKSSSDAITSDGWHDFSGFNVAITGGTPVWLACETDSGSLLWYYNAGGANYYQGSGSSGYGTFPSWYTAGSYGAYTTSIYAVYTPSSASSSSSSSSATFGTTTVGGSIATLYTGIPRATQYTPPSSGTLTDVVLYLTGGGSGRHAQVAVYADNGNVPGALLAKSSSDAITSDGWHDFSGFNVAITGGTPVWLACETDSGSLLWYYNAGGANYYQGSGSSGYGTFPSWYTAGSYGAYTTSIYAVYTPS